MRRLAAASSPTPRSSSHMRLVHNSLHDKLARHARAKRINEYYATNYAIHEAIIMLADNRWLAQVIGDLRKILKLARLQQLHAPGRLELLGNHTDYNEGLVLSVATDRYLFIASAPRTDGKVELVSSAFPQGDSFWISELIHNPAAAWADYVKGVLVQLRRRGVHFSGFNAAIHSTIPMGVGMSSSAALEIGRASCRERVCSTV